MSSVSEQVEMEAESSCWPEPLPSRPASSCAHTSVLKVYPPHPHYHTQLRVESVLVAVSRKSQVESWTLGTPSKEMLYTKCCVPPNPTLYFEVLTSGMAIFGDRASKEVCECSKSPSRI